MMKKVLCLMMAWCLLAVPTALAAEDLTGRPLADGVVSAVHYLDVTAPMSGTLNAFDLTAGDTVAAGQNLMGFVTTGVYATENATVGAVFVQPGDDAAAAMARYGMLLGLEPAQSQQIQASTTGAYNDDANRTLHLGETLYFKSNKSSRVEGQGQVVAVSGAQYTVDVLAGDFELNESLTLYRDDGYDQKDCVGKGTIVRRDPLPVQGSGRVAAVHVQEGQQVTAGQLLLELVSADADPQAFSPWVTAQEAGVVASVDVTPGSAAAKGAKLITVAVTPGQQVWKGQLLCRLYLTDDLEVVAEVDEMDLGTLRVGDTLPVTLDMNPEQIITGTVTEISALGVTRQNAAYYTVHVSIPASSGRLGASASVYLN